jgi:hypothetical protein
MESREKSATPVATAPWNKGKLIGAKPPLRPKHVWSIRTKLQVEERKSGLRQAKIYAEQDHERK